MAEFKPIKCTKAQMDAKAKSEGQLFFCTDTGHIYLDISSSNRMILNANKAIQDSAGQQINTTYIKNLSLNTSTNKLTYTKGNGSTGNIDLPYITKEYVDKLEYQLNYEPLELTFYNSMPSNMIGSMLDIGADISLSPGSGGDVYFAIQAPTTDVSYGGLLISVSEDFDGTIIVEEVSGSMTYDLSDRTIQISESGMSYPFKFKMIINCDVTSGPNSQIFIRRVADFNADTSTNSTQYLSVRNKTAYMPTEDYHPATKKYVDSAITNSNNSTSTSINREIEVLYMNNKLQTYNLITSNNIFPTLTSPQYIKKIDFKGIPLSTECTNWSNAFINTNNLFEINNLDTSAVKNLYQAFKNSQISFLPRLHLEKCASVQNIFYNCSNLIAIGGMKLSTYVGTTNLDYSFYNCNKLLSLGLYRSGGFDSMNYTFCNCCSLNMESTLSQIYSWGNLISATYAFYNTNIQNIISAPKLLQAASMYSCCNNLKQVMISNASSLINASQMFYGCSNLSTVNILNANHLENASGMFSNCKNLTEVSMLYCNNFVNASEIFSACNNLHIVPELNLYNATDVSGLFAYSNNIYSNQINNIYNTLLTINVQNIPNNQRNVSNTNWYGPLRDSKISWSNFDSTQQSALTSAGWTY